MNKKIYFISDVHLGLQKKEKELEKENKLVDFLRSIRGDASKLFILGDLFDYWFEYNRVYQKGYFRTLNELYELSKNGCEIHYFIGNHDFSHRDFFSSEIGAKMYEDAAWFELEGKKFFLGHGDGLVKNDYGYLVLKKILRNKFFQRVYSLVHPDIAIAIASGASKSSRDYTAGKDYGESDGLFDAAAKKIDEGADFVIFGHLHQRIFQRYNNGRYINLGSWLTTPCYGLFYNNNFEIIDI